MTAYTEIIPGDLIAPLLPAYHPEVGRPDATPKVTGVSKTRHEHFVGNEKEKCASCFFHHLLKASAEFPEDNGRRVAAGNARDRAPGAVHAPV
jgi:hypothetical protein